MLSKLKNNDFVWNALGVGLNSFNSLFFMIIVTRINGLNEAGIFSYAFALGCLFYYGAMFYNRPYQVSNFKNYDFNSFLSTRIMTSLISLIVIFLFSIVSGFSQYKILIILLIFLYRIIEAIAECFYGYVHAKDRLYFAGKSIFIKSISGILAFTVTDIITSNLVISLIMLLISNVIVLLLYDLKELKKIETTKIEWKTKYLKIILTNTISIFIFSFLANFLYNMQKYIITYFVSDEMQSVFSILIMPATIMILGGTCLINPFINKFTEFKSKKRFKEFNKLLIKIIGILFGIVILAIVFCNYLGIPLLNIVYNVNLNGQKKLLLLVICGSFFTAIVNILSGCLTILNKNKEQLVIYIIVTLCSLILSLILIKNHFISGAVYSFFASMVLLLIMYVIIYIISIKRMKNSGRKENIE